MVAQDRYVDGDAISIVQKLDCDVSSLFSLLSTVGGERDVLETTARSKSG